MGTVLDPAEGREAHPRLSCGLSERKMLVGAFPTHETERETGSVGDIRTNVRLVLPYTGCLRCNDLTSATRLQDESRGVEERERNRYVEEVPAPGVITFNTLSAAQTADDFLLMMGELLDKGAPTDYLRVRPRERLMEPVRPSPSRAACRDCGIASTSRGARGDGVELPLRQRRR